MTEVGYLKSRLDNEQIRYLKRDKIAAVSLASDGAMGTPSEVVVFFAGDDCIAEYKGSITFSVGCGNGTQQEMN